MIVRNKFVELGLAEINSKASTDLILPQRRYKAIAKECAKIMTPATMWLMGLCLVSFKILKKLKFLSSSDLWQSRHEQALAGHGK